MRLRSLIGALTIPTVALGAVACSSGGSSGTAGGGSAGAGAGSTLTYWASNQGTSLDNDKQVLTPELEKFTQQTGIKVNLEVIGWNDLQTRIQTAITSGSGPDVLNIGNTWAASLQATKAFLPYDQAAMTAIGGKDKFVKAALDTGGATGQDVTSVPLYGLAYGLYYNKAMLKDAGINPPTTWEDMVSAAQKLTDPARKTYGFALAAGSYTENVHFAFINGSQNGANWFDKGGKPTFTSDANVQGVLRYLDLMQKDKVVNTSNAQYDNGTKAVNDFASKKVAMILSQNNADNSIVSNGMKSDEYGVVPFPAPAGSQSSLGKPFSSLPVLKDAKPAFTDNAEEAKTFQEIYANQSKPLPLVPAEDQFESTVGKAMNGMFAKIATGGTVSADEVKKALKDAEDQVSATVG